MCTSVFFRLGRYRDTPLSETAYNKIYDGDLHDARVQVANFGKLSFGSCLRACVCRISRQ